MPRFLLWLALAHALALVAVSAAAETPLPPKVASELPGLHLSGEGRMSWFGLHLYDAALWIAGDSWNAREPYALDLRYARNFDKDRLVETSIDEMRKLGYADERDLAAWSREMTRVFPSVGPGDRLIGVFVPGKGAVFYDQNGLRGTIEDSAFAHAFFSIWLDPRTREPDLRKQLLGSQ